MDAPERLLVTEQGDAYVPGLVPEYAPPTTEYVRADLHAAEVERLRKRCEAYRQHAVSATEHLASLGWVPAGTHAGTVEDGSRMEFSAVGPDGLPDWEREIPAPGATENAAPRQNQEADDA